ncbi:MAG: acetyl-CoA C-acetyltransferase [Deltaproteobacteria bacterium]|nr:acetyl-CoA C-acetyltransferase [Deltaproteobacteria bacterium]
MPEAWIIDAVRTPRGRGRKSTPEKPGGALEQVHPQELLAGTLRALAQRNPMDPAQVDDVVAGCLSQVRSQGACIARMAVLLAGWPVEVTGVTLNRFCGSGLQAVNFALMGVLSGQQHLVVAGGVESMSALPIGSDEGGLDGNNPDLRQLYPMVPQGISADLIATLEGFSREDLDDFALQSQTRAARARAENRFARSLVPVRDKAGRLLLEQDEHPRPDTTREGLASLEPAFARLGAWAPEGGKTLAETALEVYPQAGRINHVHHAGNSSGVVDGAAAVLIASDEFARAHGLRPRARIRASATAGSEPVLMLTAPGPASLKALAKCDLAPGDIDLWEINEAFACVPLKTIRDLGLDADRVNVNGGAIALGHPIGATGAMLLGTALDELERSGLQMALVTMCIGGGMGVATIIERI